MFPIVIWSHTLGYKMDWEISTKICPLVQQWYGCYGSWIEGLILKTELMPEPRPWGLGRTCGLGPRGQPPASILLDRYSIKPPCSAYLYAHRLVHVLILSKKLLFVVDVD